MEAFDRFAMPFLFRYYVFIYCPFLNIMQMVNEPNYSNGNDIFVFKFSLTLRAELLGAECFAKHRITIHAIIRILN